MTYTDALKQCRKVGTAHAKGDALRAMYADLIAFQSGLTPKKYGPTLYAWLQRYESEQAIAVEARSLLRDRVAAWDVAVNGRVENGTFVVGDVDAG